MQSPSTEVTSSFWKNASNGMKIANFETSLQKCTPSPLLISVVVKHLGQRVAFGVRVMPSFSVW